MANLGPLPPAQTSPVGRNTVQNAASFPTSLFGGSSNASASAPLSSFFSGAGTSLKNVVYWGVGALALIALAGPYPNLATGFCVLLIVGVVLTHYKDYTGLLPSTGG